MMMPSFFREYWDFRLSDIFGDDTEVPITDESLSWLEMPSREFLRYAEGRPRFSFDWVPEDPATFQNSPTLLLAQAHRFWLTLRAIDRFLPAQPGSTVLDLGGFPFTIDIGIRDYLERDSQILTTYNLPPAADWTEALVPRRIEVIPVNLDPLVRPTTPIAGMTDHLPMPDASVDFIVFAHVIEHLYHPLDILSESVRVLKPGGRLLLTTDNGFLLGGLLNYLDAGKHLHEPVEGTAAMVFSEWRGHVRFYTEGDLTTLLERVGLVVMRTSLYEVLYNSVPEHYFVNPFLQMPRWRAELLTRFPVYRNEVMIIAEKSAL
ncbi:MAG: class I SAM-dependent methyltransferase [Bryobacteraceae bacterium]|jgi:SAM-dependent methyltransferase